MARSSLPRRPRVIGQKRTIAIVASMYNEPYVNALVESARDEIRTVMPTASVPLYRVPGAFEIPVCAEFVAQRAGIDAVLALGVVIRGETAHADLIAHSVVMALQDLARKHLLPIINEVLLVDSERQAEERCFGQQLNRGTEGARAAVRMTELFQKLNATYPAAASRNP